MKYFYYAVLVYVLISFYEWFIHRHIMHGNPEFLKKFPIFGNYLSKTAIDHVEHHKHVNIDMTLKTDEESEGVYFPWSVTLITTIIFFINAMGLIPNAFVVAVLVVALHNILWNNWHTRFHDYKKDVTLSHGLPKFSIFPTGIIYDALWKYHTLHHAQKGDKYNFNIICPLFDHVFGTYKSGTCIDNMKYCKENHHDDRCYQEQYYCFTNKDIIS